MEYKYTGIILNKKDIGETDRIYNVYTLEQGKISAIARGVRKPKAKLAGHLENFCLVDLTVMKNRGMGNISGSIVENHFKSLRNNFDSLEKAFEAVKVLSRLINDQEKDEQVFFIFLNLLHTLEQASQKESCDSVHKNLIVQGFVFKLLDVLGYKLEMKKCVKCQKNIVSERNYFDYSRGGLVCGQCARNCNNILPISNNSIKIIRIFFQNEIGNLLKLKISHKEARELSFASDYFIRWVC